MASMKSCMKLLDHLGFSTARLSQQIFCCVSSAEQSKNVLNDSTTHWRDGFIPDKNQRWCFCE